MDIGYDVARFVFGNVAIHALASLVPIFGSAVNATLTFGITEAMGWGLYIILR